MSKIEVKPISRKSDLVTQEHEKEILIYDLIIDKAFSLNETSSLIWNLCDGKNSVSDISASLSKKLKSSIDEDFVWLALEQFKKDNLLANVEEISINFGGLSRRDVIRKIGFASLIALPMVSSLLAPTAVNAASGSCTTGASNRALGCPCTAITQCQPPANRCCVNSPPAPTNGTCQQSNTAVDLTGVCGNNCTCISNCCASGICVAFRTLTAGTACSTGCQCSTGTCSGGFCT